MLCSLSPSLHLHTHKHTPFFLAPTSGASRSRHHLTLRDLVAFAVQIQSTSSHNTRLQRSHLRRPSSQHTRFLTSSAECPTLAWACLPTASEGPDHTWTCLTLAFTTDTGGECKRHGAHSSSVADSWLKIPFLHDCVLLRIGCRIPLCSDAAPPSAPVLLPARHGL